MPKFSVGKVCIFREKVFFLMQPLAGIKCIITKVLKPDLHECNPDDPEYRVEFSGQKNFRVWEDEIAPLKEA